MDPATTSIYTLSLHDALPISKIICDIGPEPIPMDDGVCWSRIPHHRIAGRASPDSHQLALAIRWWGIRDQQTPSSIRSEEHTSELQSLTNLVCRLLLEKKKLK